MIEKFEPQSIEEAVRICVVPIDEHLTELNVSLPDRVLQAALLFVEHNGEMRALGSDFIGIPLPRGLRHRIDLGDIDDRTGAVAWVRPLVEDVDLVAGLAADSLRLLATDEDAAVGVVADPELGPDLEILVGILADEISEVLALKLVSQKCAVLHRPVGFADLVPVAHFGAVDQRDPAVALAGRHARILKGGSSDQNAGRERR